MRSRTRHARHALHNRRAFKLRRASRRKNRRQNGGAKPTLNPANPKLFNNGFPSIGFGCWGRSPANVLAALEAGYRCFDCAENYGNSVDIGRVIRDWIDAGNGTREELFIIGKGDTTEEFEHQRTTVGQGYLDACILHGGTNGSGIHGESQDFSIKWDFLSNNPVRYRKIGISNIYPNELRGIQSKIIENGWRKIDVIENEIKPGVPDLAFVDACQAQDPPIHMIAYSTLSTPFHPTNKVQTTMSALKDSFDELRDYSWNQLTLKWATQRGITVIPSSKSLDHMRNNLESVTKPDLSEEVMSRINAIDNDLRSVSRNFFLYDAMFADGV